MIKECPCREITGCPGCIHSHHCPGNNEILDKQAAIIILEELVAQGHDNATTDKQKILQSSDEYDIEEEVENEGELDYLVSKESRNKFILDLCNTISGNT